MLSPQEIDEFYRLDLEFQQPEFKQKRLRYEHLAQQFRAAYQDRSADQSFVAHGFQSSLWVSAKGEKSDLDQARAFRLMKKQLGNADEIFRFFKCSIEGARDVLGKNVTASLVTTTRSGVRHLQVVARQDQAAAEKPAATAA